MGLNVRSGQARVYLGTCMARFVAIIFTPLETP
mgnify:CR=1 FL=1